MKKACEIGSKLLWFLNTSACKQAPQYSKFLPGRMPPEMAPQMLWRSGPQARRAAGRCVAQHDGGAGDRAASSCSPGRPETVYRQIMDCYDELGGFGHLIFIGRSGFLTHAEAEKSIRLFATEVLPRLQETQQTVAA